MPKILLVVLLLAELAFQIVSAGSILAPDDAKFWDRFLRDENSLSLPPTPSPTERPSPQPTESPTFNPTFEPTAEPTPIPSPAPTQEPSPGPTLSPTPGPTSNPTIAPTGSPTVAPTPEPTRSPSAFPTKSPTPKPTPIPTVAPTVQPTPEPQQNCFVDVVLDCTTSEGLGCADIVPPASTSCASGSEISVVTFSFQGNTCNPESNSQGDEASCEDVGDLNFPSAKQVECRGQEGGLMVVAPSFIEPGQSFTVSSPDNGALPEKIECTLLDGQSPVQVNLIDTSGTVDLQLGDSFGALQLESCDDISCREVICYSIAIQNVGTVSMNVTKVEFTLEDTTANLLDQVTDSSLDPGQFTSLEPCVEIGICGGNEYSAFVDVEANPPNGDICQADDEFSFQISALPPTAPQVPAPVAIPVPSPTALPSLLETPAPVSIPAPVQTTSPVNIPAPVQTPSPVPPAVDECIITLNTTCVIGGNTAFTGNTCAGAPPPIEPCLDRPTGATMLFNGGDCSQSDNIQPDKFSCQDFGPISTTLGEPYYIVVTDAKGKGITYFSGIVTVGDTYPLNDAGQRFEADQIIQVYTADQATILQNVQYHSSCSQNLELKNRFGANQLVEFVNEEQGVVSCFQTFTFDLNVSVPIGVAGSEAITITTLTAATNFAGFIDLTPQVDGSTIQPGGSIVATLEGTIDFSTARQYIIDFYVEGVDAEGNVCLGSERVSFVAGGSPGQPLPPTLPPNAPPSAIETAVPEPPIPTAPQAPFASPTISMPSMPGGSKKKKGSPGPTVTQVSNNKGKGPTASAPAQAPVVSSKKRNAQISPAPLFTLIVPLP